MLISGEELRIADCGLRIADFGLRIADFQVRAAAAGCAQTGDGLEFGLQFRCVLHDTHPHAIV